VCKLKPEWHSNKDKYKGRNESTLEKEIVDFISKAKTHDLGNSKLKGIIVPHAGYRWSGPTAAWGYININPTKYKRVFLLGPSHHAYFQGCGLTKSKMYETPFGDIEIDKEITSELNKKEGFIEISKDVDENEHSLEMQLPYLRYMFGKNYFSLVPIMVGQTTQDQENSIGKILSEYYKNEENLFVISSDFCHWGQRFRYVYYKENDGEIYQSIEKLDRKGMEIIESQDPTNFSKYLEETKNTICGRKPITIFLNILKNSSISSTTKFIRYDQSSQVKDKSDSSVSYAVALNYL